MDAVPSVLLVRVVMALMHFAVPWIQIQFHKPPPGAPSGASLLGV